jgi:hypothetical protein
MRRLLKFALMGIGRPSSTRKPPRGEKYDISLILSQTGKKLTSFQIRAARAILGWSAEDLARESAVSMRTISRAELADIRTRMTAPNDLSVRRALEAAGIEFIDQNGGGPGVRLRAPLSNKD